MKNVITLTILLSLTFSACQNDKTVSVPAPHIDAIAYTIRTEKTELFVEFKPFIVGEISTFAAHFTNMKNFKAFEEGSVTVSLIKNGKGIRQTVEAPSSPGIFRPALQPKEKGNYQLVFEIESAGLTDKLVIEDVAVYENLKEAIASIPVEEEGAEISYLKEQAWKVDFAIYKVERQSIRNVIKTSGKIESKSGDEFVLTAKTNGVALFNGGILIGDDVDKDQSLFTISGAGTTDDNVESKFAISKAEYEKAKADHNRGVELVEDNIISQKDFDEMKAKLEIAKTKYQNIVANYEQGGQKIKAPFSGFVKDLLIKEGQYVQIGDPLAVIAKSKSLIIQADVSQKYFAQLDKITSANFTTEYDNSTYNMDSLNGKFLSYGKSVNSHSNYLPVHFEIENPGTLLSGSFVEVFLKTTPLENALVVPISAIMEDYENHYVYVQTGGESFEKRDIKIGVNDGLQVQLLSGVKEDEWVVTKGAYQIKLASMSSEVPAHGHSH